MPDFKAMIENKAGMPVTFIPTEGDVVAKSDTVIFEPGILYVGVSGDVVVKTVGGSILTFIGVPSGSFIPVFVIMVYAATTATDILVLR